MAKYRVSIKKPVHAVNSDPIIVQKVDCSFPSELEAHIAARELSRALKSAGFEELSVTVADLERGPKETWFG